MRILIVILVLLLGACRTTDSEHEKVFVHSSGQHHVTVLPILVDHHGHGTGYQEISPSGVKVKYETDVPRIPIETIDIWYKQAEQCTGISSRGGFVFVVGDIPGVAVGRTYLDDGTILIEEDFVNSSRVWRHEFTHYLLWVAEYPAKKNADHDSPFFSQCGV